MSLANTSPQIPGIRLGAAGAGIKRHDRDDILLIEMAEGSGLSAEVWYEKIPAIPGVKDYIAQGVFPDGTTRNWSSYGEKVKFEKGTPVAEAFKLLPDPQTNGGLLIAVAPESKEEVLSVFEKNGLSGFSMPIGQMKVKEEKSVLSLP